MKKSRKIASIIFGILAAIIIVVGQMGYVSTPVKSTKKTAAKTEQTETKSDQTDDQQSDFIVSYQAVAQVVHINLDHALHQIGQITFEVVSSNWLQFNDILPVSEYLETLLQQIISPNAP